jgi:hypothetical protein
VTKQNNTTPCRRAVLQAGLAAVAGAVAVSTARAAESPVRAQRFAQEKIAQNLVQYQPTPKDGAKCNLCVNWVEPNACKIVAGTISPSGWCVAYAPKNG